MPQRRGLQGGPRQFYPGDSWPDDDPVESAPVAARYAAAIATALKSVINERGIKVGELTTDADIARSTLNDILTGRVWPDMVTLSKLEDVLQAPLWPQRFSTPAPPTTAGT
jgi:lambda repressor-like predicted transcriptional regulator